ncbi:SUMF1/EgtB/PvdO family nonheme iron enzyme [Sorangium sp. So ce1036]|uniref:SUMF1/EgtB/PvdO family nonheme iron enzyme n=1 Tax=Sorangium sp. So ce1036 TaxID=3133328 RepID=UPI003F05D6FC
MRRLLLPFPALVLAAACSGAPPEPAQPAAPPRARIEAPPATAPAPAETAGAAATPPSAPAEPAEPGAAAEADAGAEEARACPADMKLVEGEYCTEVEHTCLRSWYDKSNKKTVCEEFAPTPGRCTGEKVKKRYCIDTYEWPNKEGERPEVMNRFHQAQVKCAAVGKRLCTESEWTLACEGPEMKPFPYGYSRDATKCNGDHLWDNPDMKKVAKRDPDELARLWKGVRSGSQAQCISDYGVADLPANADEVVASETTGGWRGKYDSVHTGGPWYKGVRNQCRPKIYTHDEGFYYYFLSFRCCAEPDGEATDPRTPRQIREGWKMDRVERSARFTVAEMREKLELKEQGKCECKAHDILCKTMCGTLLGPGAVDATPGGAPAAKGGATAAKGGATDGKER